VVPLSPFPLLKVERCKEKVLDFFHDAIHTIHVKQLNDDFISQGFTGALPTGMSLLAFSFFA
jgi:hypothetical protein